MIWATLSRVYRQPRYVGLTTLVAAVTLSTLLLLPNRALLFSILFSSTVEWQNKLSFFVSLHGALATNFTWLTGTYTVLIALLLGMNVSLLVYYTVRSQGSRRADRSLALAGVGGFVSSLLGIGCAACGTIVVTGALNILGIAWLLTYLPLHGAEFGILAVCLLLLTVFTLIKRINDPLVCRVT